MVEGVVCKRYMSINQFPRISKQTVTTAEPTGPFLSRRRALYLFLGSTAIGTLALAWNATRTEDSHTSQELLYELQQLKGTVDNAYRFQNFMLDLYGTGEKLRLGQSYSDQQKLFSTAFLYDNALMLLSYLAQLGGAGIARARLLGDSLLYAQLHDPIGDGRLRQAYFTNPFLLKNGNVFLITRPFDFQRSTVGDLAWCGLALAQLFAHTHVSKYLHGALSIASWIYRHTYDERGAGGYTFGVDSAQHTLLYKSTEHNIDTYALFRMLARLTGLASWSERALHALNSIKAMWNNNDGFFWTGTRDDGVTINKDFIPLDVQAWSYLSLYQPRYTHALDWAVKHLSTYDTPQSLHTHLYGSQNMRGVTYADRSRIVTPSHTPAHALVSDPDAVWFEGTAQIIAALLHRGLPTDTDTLTSFLKSMRLAQGLLGRNQSANGITIPAGTGIVAASSPLDTGSGSTYNPNLHIGATAWYCLAVQGFNPYRLKGDDAPTELEM